MKEFKKPHTIADQSNNEVRKSQKHDVNLQKNSTLYFQVGLIICLLTTYGLFEMNFEKSTLKDKDYTNLIDEPTVFTMDDFKIYEEITEKREPELKPKKLATTEPKIVEDDYKDEVTTDIVTPDQTTTDQPIKIDDLIRVEAPVKPIEKPFNMINVEKVPVYPGCERSRTNAERKKCMTAKITKLIQRKFDQSLAVDLGLTGLQRINVQFKIDKTGNVVEIKTRAPYSQLEKEAERVVNKIPTMKPGMQRDKPVSVIYNLPIAFKVN